MKTTTLALLGALALAPALSACSTETAPADDTARIVSDDSLRDGLVDLDDSLAGEAGTELDSAGAETGEAVEDAGDAIGAGLDSTGAVLGRAAGDARDAVDENVDLGRNAENQGGN